MILGEIRKRWGEMTQAAIAELHGVTRGEISQLEKRADALVSNLAEHVRVLGGKLEIVARFKDADDVWFTQFEGVRERLIGTAADGFEDLADRIIDDNEKLANR